MIQSKRKKDFLASSRKLKRKRALRKLLLGFLAFLAVLSSIVYFLHLPYFRINAVRVEGFSERLEEDILANILLGLHGKRFGILPYNNIFILPKDKLASSLTESFSEIESLEIKRDWPRGALIKGKEREVFALWCADGENCAYIDKNGFIFKQAPIFAGNIFLKFFSPGRNFEVGSQMIPENEFRELYKFLRMASGLRIKIIKAVLEDGVYNLETLSGLKIILNNKKTAQRFFEDLNIFIESRAEKGGLDNLDYIDLRFGNKVFYKFKSE
jgi:hypothetical protein